MTCSIDLDDALPDDANVDREPLLASASGAPAHDKRNGIRLLPRSEPLASVTTEYINMLRDQLATVPAGSDPRYEIVEI